MNKEKSSIVGYIFSGALLLCAILWGLGAHFNVGFFTDPYAIDLASKLLVGTLVASFFLFILFDESDTSPLLD